MGLLSLFICACGASSKRSNVTAQPGDTMDIQHAPSAPIIDPFYGPQPTVFDCTTKTTPEERRATTPWGCVLDYGCDEPMVVAHRGAGGQFASIAPENSRAAIRAALWMGVDGVEVDVRHTQDEQLVVIHDSTVERTTHGSGVVSEMTASEVTALTLLDENDMGEAYAGDYSCETVPTLLEIFELTRDRVFIDLDTKTDRVDLVVQAIEEAAMFDQVFVSVSDVARAQEARLLNPKVRIQVRPSDLSEWAEHEALFPERLPEIVEVSLPHLAAFVDPIASIDAKLFSDAWEHDIQVRLDVEPLDIYLQSFETGANIIQSEFPGAVLSALERL